MHSTVTVIILLCIIILSVVLGVRFKDLQSPEEKIREGLEPEEASKLNGNIKVSQLVNADYAVQNFNNSIINGEVLIKNLNQLSIDNPTYNKLLNKRDVPGIVSTTTSTMEKIPAIALFNDEVPVYTKV